MIELWVTMSFTASVMVKLSDGTSCADLAKNDSFEIHDGKAEPTIKAAIPPAGILYKISSPHIFLLKSFFNKNIILLLPNKVKVFY